jgi:Mrp family chromosome partitioning ATPase
MVDGAILVVRVGNTSREAVRRAASHLRAVHSRVLGAVLNDIDASSGGYYGGYGYYAYAYHSHDEAELTVRDRLRKIVKRESSTP